MTGGLSIFQFLITATERYVVESYAR